MLARTNLNTDWIVTVNVPLSNDTRPVSFNKNIVILFNSYIFVFVHKITQKACSSDSI